MALIVRSSAIHAAGCYTTTPIAKNRRVAEYTGPRVSKDEADKTYEESPITYLFGLGRGEIVIDGHCVAMFINHSCDANCETSEIRGRVWIKSMRAIEAGEEITYDYCLYDGGDDKAVCNCGTKKCRGTMYSKEEIRRRKAAANRTAAKSAESPAKATAEKVPGKRNPGGKKKKSNR
jgi:SET domain-containing protein